ncbi:hypothetical protein GCM10017673_42440 [Streptosporangium violaceochromogenes]|nr:hypothetical protein GCM10017673_42440 [Streptosporangium violaceochromogenes]
MSDHALIQQWRNPHTRAAEITHPAGDIVLDRLVVGGAQPRTEFIMTMQCCPTISGPPCTNP